MNNLLGTVQGLMQQLTPSNGNQQGQDQMNNLLKKWNKPDSQANFYLKSGLGNAYSDKGRFNSKKSIAGFTGISTDWENQRCFIQYRSSSFFRRTECSTTMKRFRNQLKEEAIIEFV